MNKQLTLISFVLFSSACSGSKNLLQTTATAAVTPAQIDAERPDAPIMSNRTEANVGYGGDDEVPVLNVVESEAHEEAPTDLSLNCTQMLEANPKVLAATVACQALDSEGKPALVSGNFVVSSTPVSGIITALKRLRGETRGNEIVVEFHGSDPSDINKSARGLRVTLTNGAMTLKNVSVIPEEPATIAQIWSSVDGALPYAEDLSTGMKWAQAQNAATSLLEAREHCSNLVLNNLRDWRVPTAAELLLAEKHGLFAKETRDSLKILKDLPGAYWSTTAALNAAYVFDPAQGDPVVRQTEDKTYQFVCVSE